MSLCSNPVVTATDDKTVNEGDIIMSLQAASFTDKGILDIHNASINWGDGGVSPGIISEADGSGTVSGSHIYEDNGEYLVTVTVDDDEGSGSDTFTIIVNNVAPIVGPGENQIAAINQEISIQLPFDDPAGAEDSPYSCEVDWGDETPDEECEIEEPTSNGMAIASHMYEDKGTFEITITVTDKDGGSGENTVTVKVGDMVIDLNEGWNLFSVPKVLEDNNVEVVTDNFIPLDFSLILTYENAAWTQPETIETLKAYWIKMNSPMQLLLTFRDETTCIDGSCIVPEARALDSGWQLIGFTDTEPLLSTLALKSIEDSYSQWFGFKNNAWITHIFSQVPDKAMEPGLGYWVFMTEPSVLAALSI